MRTFKLLRGLTTQVILQNKLALRHGSSAARGVPSLLSPAQPLEMWANCRTITHQKQMKPQQIDSKPLELEEEDADSQTLETVEEPTGPRKIKMGDGWNTTENPSAIKLSNKYPELVEFNFHRVMEYLAKMGEIGITKDIATQMLLKYPPVMKTPKEKIGDTVSALRAIKYKEDSRNILLSTHPRLVDITGSEIINRFGFLKNYFDNPREVLDAILQGIECLIEKDIVVKRKLEYLIKEVSHDTKSISKCNVLSFSLKRIITRHEFLIRAGLFKPIAYQKLIKVLEKEKNSTTERQHYFKPSLVVCSGDKEFLKICTKGVFSANDLAAFEEIYVNNPRANVKDLDNYDVPKINIHYNPDNELPPGHDIHGDDLNSRGYASPIESNNFYF